MITSFFLQLDISILKNILIYIIIMLPINLWFSFKLLEDAKTKSSDKKTNPIIESIMNLLAIMFAIGIFMFLPIFSAGYLSNDNPITFNIIAGGIRICVFLTYLILISRLKDVQVLFQYHGAEHKTIFTFEDGAELSYENTKKYQKEHPRC